MPESKKLSNVGLLLIVIILLFLCSGVGRRLVKSICSNSIITIARELESQKLYRASNFFYEIALDYSSTTKWVDLHIAQNMRSLYWDKPLTTEKKVNLRKALKHLDVEFAKRPNDPYIVQEYGFIYQQLEEFDKAIEYYKKALEINPKMEYCFDKLAHIYSAIKLDYEKALEYQDKKMEIHIDEGYYGDYYNKGYILAHLGRDKEAVECYEKYIEKNPHHVAGFVNIAISEVKIGRYDDAEKHVNEGLKYAPNFSYLLNTKVSILAHKHKFDEAINLANKILEYEPYNYVSYFALARINQYKGDLEQAEKYYQMSKDKAQEYYNKYCKNHYDVGDFDGRCGNRYDFLQHFEESKNEPVEF